MPKVMTLTGHILERDGRGSLRWQKLKHRKVADLETCTIVNFILSGVRLLHSRCSVNFSHERRENRHDQKSGCGGKPEVYGCKTQIHLVRYAWLTGKAGRLGHLQMQDLDLPCGQGNSRRLKSRCLETHAGCSLGRCDCYAGPCHSAALELSLISLCLSFLIWCKAVLLILFLVCPCRK